MKLLSDSLNSGHFASDYAHPSIFASLRVKENLITDTVPNQLKLLKGSQRIKHVLDIKNMM